MLLWIALGIAGLGFWYYETNIANVPPAAKPPALDTNMPTALRDILLTGVPLEKDPSKLDTLANGLASAPPPGPYPIAAQWVRDQAAFLRSHMQKDTSSGNIMQMDNQPMSAPAPGNTPVMIPSRGQAGRPPVNLAHPTLIAAHFFQVAAMANAQKKGISLQGLNLKGQALVDLAWKAENATTGAQQAKWHSLGILGHLQMEPTSAKYLALAAADPYFAMGAPGALALGWPDAAPVEILPYIAKGQTLANIAFNRLNADGKGNLYLFGPDNDPASLNQIALPPATSLLKNLVILGHLEAGVMDPWKFMASKSTFFRKGAPGSLALGIVYANG